MRKLFEPWEKDFIRLAYPLFKAKDIGEVINRSKGVVQDFAGRFKLKKCRPKIGDVFGKLKIISKCKHGEQYEYTCKCECGNIMTAIGYSLVSGHSSTCGCGRIEAISHGYEYVSGMIYGNIVKRAKQNNREFDLTIKFINDLLIKQDFKCALSGLPISINTHRINYKYQETTASLDRIDSSKGYTKDNVQWVHKYINWIKLDFSQEEFIQLCQAVAKNQRKKNVVTNTKHSEISDS
jgi:hypothetical protein